MILYATIAVGCEECMEQTNVIYIGVDIEKARQPLLDWVKTNPGTPTRRSQIQEGPRFDGEYDTTCIEYFGYLELHKLEVTDQSSSELESSFDPSRGVSGAPYGAPTGREGS